MGQAYEDFAVIYDGFMGDAPYQEWLTWFSSIDVASKEIADVGCGTGTLAIELAKRKARVTGVDLSSSMLATALARATEERVRVTWLCQDMRELVLPTQVDMVVSTCDSINYLLNEADLRLAFGRFYDVLKPGGFVCFDVLGKDRLNRLQNGVWFDVRDDAELWFTSEVRQDGQIEYEVHAFFETQDSPGLYKRVIERHTERFYPLETLRGILEESGFIVKSIEGDFGDIDPNSADRMVFVGKKPNF